MIISVFVEGFPTTQPGYSCGVLKNGIGSEWSNEPCSEKHGYICQKGHSVPTIPPGRLSNHCFIPHSKQQFSNRSVKNGAVHAKTNI